MFFDNDGRATTGWGGREAVKKVKLQNEPKFEQAGVENCETESQKRTQVVATSGGRRSG